MTKNETKCLFCQGAGLVPDPCSSRKVKPCQVCKGFGILAVDPATKAETPYTVDSKHTPGMAAHYYTLLGGDRDDAR